MAEREDVEPSTGPARASGTQKTVEALLNHPEVMGWLGVSRREIAAWAERDRGDDDESERVDVEPMSRPLESKESPPIVAKPLRNGDVRTVMGLFERLSERSRRARFNGPKPCLTATELRRLARTGRDRHALVAYVDGDPEPAGIARFVREGRSAEIAFAVADEHQRRGIGSALTAELVADARAAGVTEITALVSRENAAALALLRRVLTAFTVRPDGPDLAIRAAI